MTTNNRGMESGGISAKRIQADNVVSGVQGDARQAAALIDLAQAIRGGTISADEIVARNLVSGLQLISNPEQASTEDLRRELALLRTRVEQAIASQEIADPTDAEDVKDSLAVAETELAKPHPHGNQVIRKLDEATTILTRSAQASEAVGKVGNLVIQLAPVAATLWQIAQKVLGV